MAQSGKSIFVRSIDDPASCKQYVGHTAQTTVARFSPSGFYIASGDVTGTVRVWDAIEAVNTKGMANSFSYSCPRIPDPSSPRASSPPIRMPYHTCHEQSRLTGRT